MDSSSMSITAALYGAAGAAFVAFIKFGADRYLKRTDYDREDQRKQAEADRDRSQIDKERIDSLLENHRQLAIGFQSRIDQQAREIEQQSTAIRSLQTDCWGLWQKAEDAARATAECERKNQALERDKEALSRRVTALELRISELGNNGGSGSG